MTDHYKYSYNWFHLAHVSRVYVCCIACDMRMGNYLMVWTLYADTMSASTDSLGIQHLTVVPTNFESATAEEPQPTGDSDDSEQS